MNKKKTLKKAKIFNKKKSQQNRYNINTFIFLQFLNNQTDSKRVQRNLIELKFHHKAKELSQNFKAIEINITFKINKNSKKAYSLQTISPSKSIEMQ